MQWGEGNKRLYGETTWRVVFGVLRLFGFSHILPIIKVACISLHSQSGFRLARE
jgi:hypothetical protein